MTNLSVSILIAYLLFTIADSAMYVALAWFLLKSFRLHRFREVGFVVLIAPFVYALLNAGSLFTLLWMLILTPFYGLIVMTLVYPTVMLLYYVVSFGSLLGVFLLRKKVAKLRNK